MIAKTSFVTVAIQEIFERLGFVKRGVRGMWQIIKLITFSLKSSGSITIALGNLYTLEMKSADRTLALNQYFANFLKPLFDGFLKRCVLLSNSIDFLISLLLIQLEQSDF